MARFTAYEVFRLPLRGKFVILGKVTEGSVVPGMEAALEVQDKLFLIRAVAEVELIERPASAESFVGLVIIEQDPDDTAFCQLLCEGTNFEVHEAEPS